MRFHHLLGLSDHVLKVDDFIRGDHRGTPSALLLLGLVVRVHCLRASCFVLHGDSFGARDAIVLRVTLGIFVGVRCDFFTRLDHHTCLVGRVIAAILCIECGRILSRQVCHVHRMVTLTDLHRLNQIG